MILLMKKDKFNPTAIFKDLIEMTMKKMDEDKDGKVSFADFEVNIAIVFTIAFVVIIPVVLIIIIINNENNNRNKSKSK